MIMYETDTIFQTLLLSLLLFLISIISQWHSCRHLDNFLQDKLNPFLNTFYHPLINSFGHRHTIFCSSNQLSIIRESLHVCRSLFLLQHYIQVYHFYAAQYKLNSLLSKFTHKHHTFCHCRQQCNMQIANFEPQESVKRHVLCHMITKINRCCISYQSISFMALYKTPRKCVKNSNHFTFSRLVLEFFKKSNLKFSFRNI